MSQRPLRVFNDQVFNNVRILGALITQGSVTTIGNVVYSNPGANLTVDLLRNPTNATTAEIRFRTMIGAVPTSDWLLGTAAGSYIFNILQQSNATTASAGMNITLDNATLTITSTSTVFTRTGIANSLVAINRGDNTVTANLNYTTGGTSDWLIGTAAGGSILNILQQANATAATAGINVTLDNAILTVTASSTVFTRTGITNSAVAINRGNNTVTANLNYTTGGTLDWLIGTAAGGSVLNIVQQANATAATAGINVTLDNAALAIIAASTTFSRTGVANVQVTLNRTDNTVSANLAFATGGSSEWTFSLMNGGTTFSIVGFNRTLSINLGSNQMVLTAGTSTVAGISVANGVTATGATGGYRYTGTITITSASPAALNTWAGRALITGVGDIAANATASVVISNSLVTVNTIGMVNLLSTGLAAANSNPRIDNVAFGAGTITITLRNSSAAATGPGITYTFAFLLMQL